MHFVPVISAPCFRDISIGIGKVPLASTIAGIVAWCGRGKLAEHREDPSPDIIEAEVAAEAQLLQLEFLGPKGLGRAAHGVVFGMVEVENVVDIGAELGREVLGGHRRINYAAI